MTPYDFIYKTIMLLMLNDNVFVIDSFIYKSYPNLFNNGKYEVLSTKPIRIFIEKIIILHKKAHSENSSPIRYSRHYYDVYKKDP